MGVPKLLCNIALIVRFLCMFSLQFCSLWRQRKLTTFQSMEEALWWAAGFLPNPPILRKTWRWPGSGCPPTRIRRSFGQTVHRSTPPLRSMRAEWGSLLMSCSTAGQKYRYGLLAEVSALKLTWNVCGTTSESSFPIKKDGLVWCFQIPFHHTRIIYWHADCKKFPCGVILGWDKNLLRELDVKTENVFKRSNIWKKDIITLLTVDTHLFLIHTSQNMLLQWHITEKFLFRFPPHSCPMWRSVTLGPTSVWFKLQKELTIKPLPYQLAVRTNCVRAWQSSLFEVLVHFLERFHSGNGLAQHPLQMVISGQLNLTHTESETKIVITQYFKWRHDNLWRNAHCMLPFPLEFWMKIILKWKWMEL